MKYTRTDIADLNLAIRIATEAHSTQMDKAGKPYILHPLAVMLKCETPIEMTVAVLHDVIEDTDITINFLKVAEFSQAVLDALDAISKREGEDYFDFIERCKSNELCRTVKLHDLEHNMSPERQSVLQKKVSSKLMKKYTKAYDMLKRDEINEVPEV